MCLGKGAGSKGMRIFQGVDSYLDQSEHSPRVGGRLVAAGAAHVFVLATRAWKYCSFSGSELGSVQSADLFFS